MTTTEIIKAIETKGLAKADHNSTATPTRFNS